MLSRNEPEHVRRGRRASVAGGGDGPTTEVDGAAERAVLDDLRRGARELTAVGERVGALHRRRARPAHGPARVDPAKEANAQATRLSNHTTTLALEYARQGRDWEEELKQRAKEIALMNTLGLSPAQAPSNSSTQEDEDDADERKGTTARAA